MTLLRMLLVAALLGGMLPTLVACQDGGSAQPAQDWPPRRTPGGHD